MENANSFLWEVSFSEFLIVTCALAGGAAYLTGRAIANTWKPDLQLIFYMVLLAAATRFIHFALFEGSLLSLWYYVIDLLVLLCFAFAGKRITRAGQMATQYSFIYEPAGPFAWRSKKQA